ncbi:hypothetical protein QE357_004510, partial [Siphonobacter sp. BAB-5404]|nr:hypothetical protein [Siphonobacter sp. SORGH_AS_0500]
MSANDYHSVSQLIYSKLYPKQEANSTYCYT